MWDYSEKVMDMFHNPQNMGAIAPEDCMASEQVAIGEVGSIACGDALRLYLKIDTTCDRILEARFQTFGCASAIASSSALTQLVLGRTVDEALGITNQEIAAYLDGLPQEKMHCSVMGQEALEAAIANYRGIEIHAHDDEDEGPLVCQCFGISQSRILRVIQDNHLTTAEQVTHYIKAGGGCGTCLSDIDDLIEMALGATASPSLSDSYDTSRKLEDAYQSAPDLEPCPRGVAAPSATTAMTPLQRMVYIQQLIDIDIRPLLKLDGGDIELYDVQGDRVQVILSGACDGCPSVTTTLKMAIEQQLRDRISPTLVVESVKRPACVEPF
jgi:NifU-like protein